jgi:hypothetical protein
MQPEPWLAVGVALVGPAGLLTTVLFDAGAADGPAEVPTLAGAWDELVGAGAGGGAAAALSGLSEL